jgi:hypothetical protein
MSDASRCPPSQTMWWDDFVHQVQWATCCGANKTTDVVVEQKKKWAVESARVPAEYAPAAQAVFDNQRVAGHVLDECTKGNVTVSSFGTGRGRESGAQHPHTPACAPAGAHAGGEGWHVHPDGASPAPVDLGGVAQETKTKPHPRLQCSVPPTPTGVAEPLGHVVDAPKGLDLTLAFDHGDERRASCAPTRHTFSKVLYRNL